MQQIARTVFILFAISCSTQLFGAALKEIDGVLLPLPPLSTTVAGAINDGARLLSEGRSIEAEDLFRALLASHPTSAEAFYNFGLALAFNGKHLEALEAQKKALALRPDFPEAILALGVAHLTLGNNEEALKNFNTVIARVPTSPIGQAALFNKGTALGRLKRYAEAEFAFAEALAAEPEDPAPAFQIAKLKVEQGKLKEALDWLEPVALVYPLEANLLKAKIHIKLGDFNECETALATAEHALEEDKTLDDQAKERIKSELSRIKSELASQQNK